LQFIFLHDSLKRMKVPESMLSQNS